MGFDVQQFLIKYVDKSPQEILQAAFFEYGNLALAFSGAEDVVLIDMAVKINDGVSVFFLDTGRLHPETYRYVEQIRKHYPISLEVLAPDKLLVDEFVKKKGLFSFYKDGHKECCGIRKVIPLQHKLQTLSAWATGQRRDQNKLTRASLPIVEIDKVFSSSNRSLVKFNPIANWTSAQTWDYIEHQNIPFNPLHQQGYSSIGCEPCTRPVHRYQLERAGRWWWEDESLKECGLHIDQDKQKGDRDDK